MKDLNRVIAGDNTEHEDDRYRSRFSAEDRPLWYRMCPRCERMGDFRWPALKAVDWCAERSLTVPCATCISELIDNLIPKDEPVSAVTLLSRGVAHVIDQGLAWFCSTGWPPSLSW